MESPDGSQLPAIHLFLPVGSCYLGLVLLLVQNSCFSVREESDCVGSSLLDKEKFICLSGLIGLFFLHTLSISLPQTGWLMILFLEQCRIRPTSYSPLKYDSQSLLVCFSSSFHPWHKSPGLFSKGRNMLATTGCLGVYCLTPLSSFWLCQMVQQTAFGGFFNFFFMFMLVRFLN